MKKAIIALALLASAGIQAQDIYTPGEGEGIVYFLPKTQIVVDIIATRVDYKPGEFGLYANRYLRLNNVSTRPETQHENAHQYMTEDILVAGSSAKMAELTAREIYNIRESKNAILRGQADTMPKDGASLKLIISQLDKQERALTESFTGVTDRTDKVFTFTVNPEDKMSDKVFARFSSRLGVLQADNLAGDPISISISNSSSLPAPVEDGKKKKKIDGVIYNIPGKGKVSVSFQGKTKWENELQITQFGYTEVLVDGLFDKKVNTRVVFNPVTGGVIKIDKD